MMIRDWLTYISSGWETIISGHLCMIMWRRALWSDSAYGCPGHSESSFVEPAHLPGRLYHFQLYQVLFNWLLQWQPAMLISSRTSFLFTWSILWHWKTPQTNKISIPCRLWFFGQALEVSSWVKLGNWLSFLGALNFTNGIKGVSNSQEPKDKNPYISGHPINKSSYQSCVPHFQLFFMLYSFGSAMPWISV